MYIMNFYFRKIEANRKLSSFSVKFCVIQRKTRKKKYLKQTKKFEAILWWINYVLFFINKPI